MKGMHKFLFALAVMVIMTMMVAWANGPPADTGSANKMTAKKSCASVEDANWVIGNKTADQSFNADELDNKTGNTVVAKAQAKEVAKAYSGSGNTGKLPTGCTAKAKLNKN